VTAVLPGLLILRLFFRRNRGGDNFHCGCVTLCSRRQIIGGIMQVRSRREIFSALDVASGSIVETDAVAEPMTRREAVSEGFLWGADH